MFYDQYCLLCKKAGVSPSKAAMDIGIAKSTVSVWKNRGTAPQVAQLQKIADYFHVSTDYLLNGEDSRELDLQNKTPTLTRKDERDIEKILASTKELLESQEGLMFDGDPASPEAIQSILSAIELGLQAAKMKNKEKYTPNKYKK